MSFDSPRRAKVAADQPALTSERRTYLTALDQAVVAYGGMSCGVVPRAGTWAEQRVTWGARDRPAKPLDAGRLRLRLPVYDFVRLL